MKLRYPLSIFTIPGLVSLPLVLGGCGNAAEPTATATATAAPATLPAAALPHALPVAVPRARRVMRRVLEAVGHLPLATDQRAQLDDIAADVARKSVATKVARDALLEAMATQVEQGTIVRAALQPRLDALRASSADEQSALQAALTVVNGILTDSERARLADTLTPKLSEAPPRANQHRSRRDGLLGGLALSPEQSLQVNAAMPPGLLSHIERRVFVLERALPILTPAQRSMVAQRLRPQTKI